MNGGTPVDAAAADDAPPFIAVAGAPVVVGRSGEATVRLLDPTVSRRHATVARHGAGLTVEDHDSRFGTFVNGARVRVTGLRPGDRVRFGAAVTYRVEPDGLRLDAAAEGVALAAAGLALAAPDGPDFGRLLDDLRHAVRGEGTVDPVRRGRDLLLRDVGLDARPDSFVGILGPSGAGKSTLLNCLAGYRPPDWGRVLCDGRDAYAEADAYRALLGHVPQDDVVYRPLTARENLHYAARLRLGPGVGVAAATEQALERVGLVGHADKPAGVLSGGQRKRLSVAVELLRRPRLLLLDEPTSGLDPASEAQLMERLRQIARRGTTVVCTTHLMDNLRHFDEVVALGVVDGVGRLAYAGPPDGLLAHFGCRHHADLYELLATGDFEPVEQHVHDVTAVDTDAPAGSGEGRVPPGVGPTFRRPDTGATPSSVRHGIGPLAVGLAADTNWGQVSVVARRALRLMTRDRGLVLATVAQPVLLGLLVSLTQYDADKLVPLLFFAVVVAIWLGLNNSARDLVRERRYYVRDRLAGLRSGAYLGAKAAVHTAVGAVQLLILLAVLRLGYESVLQYQAVADDLHKTSVVWLFLVLLAGYLGGVGLGLLTSTLARTEEAAVAALPLLILPQLLLSVVATGAQIKRDDEPRPFRPLVVTLRGGQDLSRPAALVDALSMACLSRPAVLVAELQPMDGYGEWTWVGDLCHLLILLLATWTLVVLAFQWAERRWLHLAGL
jgi:ABC-type multidrug transport system ATPase subunit